MTAANSVGLDHICGVSADVSLIINANGSALSGDTCRGQLSTKSTAALCLWHMPSAVAAWIFRFTSSSFGMSFAPTGQAQHMKIKEPNGTGDFIAPSCSWHDGSCTEELD
ncbi:hypothetical protein [Sulfitobacter pacificus]|uniref:hypothetical protein n=1 Tax=Sulfitobacter pacificus TaxID=1499314 RepID=UPI0024E07AA3|nr:hypothetical protein [Sulfitobacter pacificus]